MKIKLSKKNLIFIGLIICSIGSTYLLIVMGLNWKNDLHELRVPMFWILITISYYYNWKTNGKRKCP